MGNSISEYLKEVFNPNKRYDKCLYCGTGISGSRRKFCSNICNQKYYRYKYSTKVKKLNKINVINSDGKPSKKEIETYDYKQKANILAYKIAKCTNGVCMLCKKKTKIIYRHHEDYSKGELFMLVCSQCHGWIKRYNNLKEKIFDTNERGLRLI